MGYFLLSTLQAHRPGAQATSAKEDHACRTHNLPTVRCNASREEQHQGCPVAMASRCLCYGLRGWDVLHRWDFDCVAEFFDRFHTLLFCLVLYWIVRATCLILGLRLPERHGHGLFDWSKCCEPNRGILPIEAEFMLDVGAPLPAFIGASRHRPGSVSSGLAHNKQ